MISQVRDAGNKRHPARVAVIISVNKKRQSGIRYCKCVVQTRDPPVTWMVRYLTRRRLTGGDTIKQLDPSLRQVQIVSTNKM